MLSYSWMETGILFSTAFAQSIHRSPARSTTRQLHCQWCSGWRYATLAANDVSVRQCHVPTTGRLTAGRCSKSLINWIKVRAIRWPKIQTDKLKQHLQHGLMLTRVSLTMQMTSGASVFVHACRQTADTSSICCRKQYACLHSTVWQHRCFIFVKYETLFDFSVVICNKFELFNFPR